MINEDLLHLKVDIQTKDDTNFLELAILLDKPEFLKLLPKLRKKYQVNELIDIQRYTQTLDTFENSKRSRLDLSMYENSKELIEFAKKNSTAFESIEDEMDLFQLLDTEANILCYIFRRPPYFTDPIKQAILCGVVNDDLFHTTSVETIEHDTLLSTAGSFQLPQIAIVISPTSTDIKIKEKVRQARELYKTDKRLTYYKPRTDKANKIRAYREWYWQRLAGKKYSEISDHWANELNIDSSNSDYDENRVYKGVEI